MAKESKEMTVLRAELAAMTVDRDAHKARADQWYKNYDAIASAQRTGKEELEFMREVVRAAVGAPAKPKAEY